LAETKQGVSLAQLPQYLKKKLPFQLDLNELGYPKLKDLIIDMQDAIKLELRGHNHPFAYLITRGRYIHKNHQSDDLQFIPKTQQIFRHNKYSEDTKLKSFI
jgi:hypothetical protein